MILVSETKLHWPIKDWFSVSSAKVHLDGGGEEPRDSSGFFWPLAGLFGGVFALFPGPIGVSADGIRELNWWNMRATSEPMDNRKQKNDNKVINLKYFGNV